MTKYEAELIRQIVLADQAFRENRRMSEYLSVMRVPNEWERWVEVYGTKMQKAATALIEQEIAIDANDDECPLRIRNMPEHQVWIRLREIHTKHS